MSALVGRSVEWRESDTNYRPVHHRGEVLDAQVCQPGPTWWLLVLRAGQLHSVALGQVMRVLEEPEPEPVRDPATAPANLPKRARRKVAP